ncbi:MAG: nucleotidyltransferase substrate binding protein [Fibromonadaceae bacterium]|jgi:nucleotidyltransferase substrate binding protein (TIGR01987 family)|nr:nucleotidyltransferase substrate binding protein [Fibromonadaceae bacterium]
MDKTVTLKQFHIDTTHLKDAILALQNCIGDYDEYSAKGESLRESLRSGVIQNFEVAYELSWKFMKKWLSYNVGSSVIDGIPRLELFKYAAENNLISDSEIWFEFHDARNKTTHEYSEEVAEFVFEQALKFLPYAEDFLETLEKKI